MVHPSTMTQEDCRIPPVAAVKLLVFFPPADVSALRIAGSDTLEVAATFLTISFIRDMHLNAKPGEADDGVSYTPSLSSDMEAAVNILHAERIKSQQLTQGGPSSQLCRMLADALPESASCVTITNTPASCWIVWQLDTSETCPDNALTDPWVFRTRPSASWPREYPPCCWKCVCHSSTLRPVEVRVADANLFQRPLAAHHVSAAAGHAPCLWAMSRRSHVFYEAADPDDSIHLSSHYAALAAIRTLLKKDAEPPDKLETETTHTATTTLCTS